MFLVLFYHIFYFLRIKGMLYEWSRECCVFVTFFILLTRQIYLSPLWANICRIFRSTIQDGRIRLANLVRGDSLAHTMIKLYRWVKRGSEIRWYFSKTLKNMSKKNIPQFFFRFGPVADPIEILSWIIEPRLIGG